MTDYCTWSPERLFGVELGEHCKYHDYYYGQQWPRDLADYLLRKDIQSQGGFMAWLLGWAYWLGVRLFGGFAYSRAS